MASLSLGTHFSPSGRHRRYSTPPLPPIHLHPSVSIHSQSLLASSLLYRIRAPGPLRGGILARAEDEAKGSSSSVRPQEQDPQPNSDGRFEVLDLSFRPYGSLI